MEIDKIIIDMLKKGVTILHIKEKTGLCPSDIASKLNELSEKGYLINRFFNDAGVKFQLANNVPYPLQDTVQINTGPSFSFIVIADTHYGNIYDNPNLVKRAYEYANEKNIKYVFHLGDIIEGCELEEKNSSRIRLLDLHDQIDYLTRNYPKYDKINTLYILGNHDYRGLNNGIDISKVISKRRLDMHFLGYKNSRLQIGNINVLLHHPFFIDKKMKYDSEIKDLYPNMNFDLILRGHTHHNEIFVNSDGSLVVNVPACYSSPNRSYTNIYEITLKNNNLTNEMEINTILLPFDREEVIPISKMYLPITPKSLIKKMQGPINNAVSSNKWQKKR